MPSLLQAFDDVMATIAAPIDYTITMDANSTNEVYSDISTGLDDEEALLIYGMEYDFENIDPTTPLDVHQNAFAGSFVHQIHRNDDATLLLNQHDSEVLLHHGYFADINTQGGYSGVERPFRRFQRNVTIQQTLRGIFVSSTDITDISQATSQLTGRIFCDSFDAPSIGVTKLGHLASL